VKNSYQNLISQESKDSTIPCSVSLPSAGVASSRKIRSGDRAVLWRGKCAAFARLKVNVHLLLSEGRGVTNEGFDFSNVNGAL